MKSLFRKIADKLIGDEHRFTLSHRILNSTAIIGIITTFLATIGNYLLKMPLFAVLISAISMFYFIVIYINSIKNIKYRITYNLMSVFLIFIFIPSFWIYNSGTTGGFQYFIFLFLIIIATTSDNIEKWVYVFSLVFVSILLITIESKYPDLILNYTSEQDRLVDIYISFSIAMLSVIFSTQVFMFGYTSANKKLKIQKKKIESQADKLELNNQQLSELNESKDTIFSVISHDLQAPVGTMKTFIDIILKDKQDVSKSELLNYLTVISKQSSSVYNTLNNLLVWSNSQHANFEFNPKKQNINIAVESSFELLEEIARQKHIELINDIKPDVVAFFDLNLISTVIRNLVSNAIKFTGEKGKVTVSSKVVDDKILVSVTDTGIGIAADRIPKIFDKSSYETTYGTNSEKGSGLGMKICLEFIEAHQGKIWVESEVDKGSIFHFTLSP